MRLPRNSIDALVPRGEPPRDSVSAAAFSLAERLGDPVLRRSYLWSMALINNAARFVPGRSTHFSAGFVYVEPQVLAESGWQHRAVESFVFGGYALVETRKGSPRQRVLTINVGERAFPLVVTHGSIELHGAPPFASTDSAACWARTPSPHAGWTHGILTCRHVVEPFGRHTPIPLTPSAHHATPTSGVMGDIDECTIDAAIIKIDPADWPHGLSRIKVRRPVAPGMSAKFDGRCTRGSGSVLRVFQDPVYFGNLFGQRLVTDFIGIPGDSGSLLRETSGGRGMGLYMGTIPDGGTGRDAIHQDLRQAVRYFRLCLYE